MRAVGLFSVSMLHIVAYFAFIVLGIPDGMLGVAWPSMSSEFSRPLGALGILLSGFTVGYLATTAAAGLLVNKLGYARHLIISGFLMTLGAGGIAFAFGWIPVVVGAGVLGAGAGMLDGGLNAYAAERFRPRDLNWLHAAYGVGATVGPLLMTPIVASSLSWRVGYVVFGLCAAAMMVAFAVSRGLWGTQPQHRQHAPRAEPAPGEESAPKTQPAPGAEPAPGAQETMRPDSPTYSASASSHEKTP
ncbi:MAG: MFS transporter, partial [Spirochaetota bacterium]